MFTKCLRFHFCLFLRESFTYFLFLCLLPSSMNNNVIALCTFSSHSHLNNKLKLWVSNCGNRRLNSAFSTSENGWSFSAINSNSLAFNVFTDWKTIWVVAAECAFLFQVILPTDGCVEERDGSLRWFSSVLVPHSFLLSTQCTFQGACYSGGSSRL